MGTYTRAGPESSRSTILNKEFNRNLAEALVLICVHLSDVFFRGRWGVGYPLVDQISLIHSTKGLGARL